MISLKSDEITNDLIRQILSGELAISSNLPSENQLAIKYKCNRHTIRKVINQLIERNYLIKTCDRVTYINNPAFYDNNRLFISSLSDLYDPNSILTSVHTFELITSSDRVCSKLNIDNNSKVWHIIRVRYVNSTVDHLEEIYMPYSLFPTLTIEDCKSSLIAFIENQYDFKINYGIREITSVKLKDFECNLLSLPLESTVMRIENIGYLTNGRIYEYSLSTCTENKFSYYCRR